MRLLAATMFVTLLSVHVHAQLFTDLWVFGDSLSDAGNRNTITLGLKDQGMRPLEAAPSPPYYEGRFSNGPVWTDHLAAGLGLSPLEPSVTGGKNFAYGSAQTGLELSTIAPVPNVGTQILEFQKTGNTINPTDLLAVWVGHNDLLNNVVFPETPIPASTIATNLSGHIRSLHDLGGRNFIVPNFSATFPGHEELNALVGQEIDMLRRELSGNIVLFDYHALESEIIADLSSFGFEHGFGEAACKDCGNGGPSTLPTDIVSDPEKYLMWDNVHPGAGMHAIIGDRAVNVLASVPEPSSSLLAVLAMAGLHSVTRCPLRARQKSSIR